MPDDVSPSTVTARTGSGGPDADPHGARQEVEALTRRLRAAEASLDAWRASHAVAIDQRDRERALVREMETCESYRLGRAIVSVAKRLARPTPDRVRKGTRRLLSRLRRYARLAGVAGKAGAEVEAGSRLAVSLYLALGVEMRELRRLLQAIKQGELLVPHVPVVVTDSASFSLLRNFGVVMEYVPDRHTWERHGAELPWERMLAERLIVVAQDHDPARTFVVDPLAPPTVAQLVRLNSALLADQGRRHMV